MKYLRLACISALIPSLAAATFDLTGISFFSPRSQSTNAARDLVGWHPFINQPNDGFYGASAITPSFGQILRSSRAAQVMFSDNLLDNDLLTISGSLVEDRGENDILADYFGLSPAFESQVKLQPFIRTGLIDFAAYFGWKDFYCSIHAPFVYTRWQLGVDEVILNDGRLVPFPANYMAATPVEEPVTSFARAVQGNVPFGDVSQGLLNGKFGCPLTKVGVSDVLVAFGYNIANNDFGHAGFNLRVGLPTGNRPRSEFLFEPIVGNGKHWELGVGFSGHVLVWEKDGTQEFSFFSDINVMHQFNTRQRRSFDFKTNGFGSRYILLKQFDAQGNYTGNSLPAINVTTLDCNVSVGAVLDIVFMFGYTYEGFVMDIGYNGWIRTREIISLRQKLALNTYGLKGIQNVTDMAGNPINTTQNTATLHGDYLTDQAIEADINSPVFIDNCNIDLLSAASPLVITHKIFGHLGHSWEPCTKYFIAPFIGVGGEIEVEGINQRKTLDVYNQTLSQWAIWLKGGVGF